MGQPLQSCLGNSCDPAPRPCGSPHVVSDPVKGSIARKPLAVEPSAESNVVDRGGTTPDSSRPLDRTPRGGTEQTASSPLCDGERVRWIGPAKPPGSSSRPNAQTSL